MTFYFYDLETSSANSSRGRIMQFAGQRTNEHLEPVGEPDNILVKLAEDTLPEPDAVLVHGITPQQAIEEGVTEAEFTEFFHNKVAQAKTVFIGYNNIRFDDEFVRRVCYRTFYDPYQWHWKDDRSRWDLLDPIRMMRALRPEGLRWPMLEGRPTVKLELLAKENGLIHENAHDALSDVQALIQLAARFKKAQPKLFEFLLGTRNKRSVAKLVEEGQPFVYSSGRYSGDFEKTTVVSMLLKHPRREAAIVYDLREDPAKWLDKTPQELAKHWRPAFGEEIDRLPVKVLQYNKCPAVAPIGVLDDASRQRIKIDMDMVAKNRQALQKAGDFVEKLEQALDILEKEQQARLPLDVPVDNQMYDGFWSDTDQSDLLKVRMADPSDLSSLQTEIKNKRIREMIPLYKARNYPEVLSSEERRAWEAHCRSVLTDGGASSQLAKFSKRMQQLATTHLTQQQEYLLTELQLYAESIMPISDET